MGSPSTPTKSGFSIVSVDSGKGGSTSVPAITEALKWFAGAYVVTNGDVGAALQNGQQALGRSTNPNDKGDRLSLALYDTHLTPPVTSDDRPKAP